MAEPVHPQPVSQRLWSPFGIAWVTLLLSSFPGGILHALNERRLGRERSWRLTLYRNLLVSALMIAPSFLTDTPSLRFTVGSNLFVAMYFYKSQADLFARHLETGGGKRGFLLPVLVSLAALVLWGLVFER